MSERTNSLGGAMVWFNGNGQCVKVGDFVAYPFLETTLNLRALESQQKAVMRVSQIKTITFDGTAGFAEVGPGMDIELENGDKFHGDGENGFIGLIKVAPFEARL